MEQIFEKYTHAHAQAHVKGNQMRHKQKVCGKAVQVVRGIAESVRSEIRRIDPNVSVEFKFVSSYKGRSKIRIEMPEPHVLAFVVCDNNHGKGRLTVRSPNASLIADQLRPRLERDGHTIA